MIAVNVFRKEHRPVASTGMTLCRCARQGVELRRRLSRLSYAGWLPHDRGFVLGLPRSGSERRLHRHRLTMLPEDSPPRSTPSLAHRQDRSAPTLAVERQALTGVTTRAMAQMNPTISRAIAVVATTFGLPDAIMCR